MQTRRLGNSDLFITAIGFGAWALGGSGWEYAWGAQDDSLSIAAIHRALDRGVNWIDTAAAYGLGHSEEVIARALAGWTGKRPLVFTKCGLRCDEQGRVRVVLNAESVRRECEDSLRRLGVEAIDLYQIHWPPVDNGPQLEEAWATLADLQREGKVRWIGVSNFNVEQMRRAQAVAPLTSLQPPYSLIRREIEADILPFCGREGVGVIAYSPMASGLLTGRLTRERIVSLPADDWRSRDAEFHEPKLSRNLRVVDRLREIGVTYGVTAGEAAIAWTLRDPVVTGAIVGLRNPIQVDGVTEAAAFRLSASVIARLEASVRAAAKLG